MTGPKVSVVLFALSMLLLPGSSQASAIGAIAYLVTKVFGEGAVVRELGHVGRAADGKTATQATGARAADVAPVRETARDLAAARNSELSQRTALQRPESSPSFSAGSVDAPQAKASSPLRADADRPGLDDWLRHAGAAARDVSNWPRGSACEENGGQRSGTPDRSKCSDARH